MKKESDIKKAQGVFDEVIEEKRINVGNFFIDYNDIFGSGEITNANREFIIDLINRTNFIADAKIFADESKAPKMETVHPEQKKIEKKEQMSIETRVKQKEINKILRSVH